MYGYIYVMKKTISCDTSCILLDESEKLYTQEHQVISFISAYSKLHEQPSLIISVHFWCIILEYKIQNSIPQRPSPLRGTAVDT